jgi:hypothetical protein
VSLTKDNIIEAVAEQLGFPKKQSVELVETLLELIKKALVSGAAIGSFAFASIALGDGIPCNRIEKAQLKDSSNKELIDAYCGAKKMAEFNENLFSIAQKDGDIKKMKETGAAHVSCIKVAESVSKMLEKKFKAKPPESCK